ncbi:uncharacterized protein MONOS_90 [Monocercomonoides exilis]|uniref:uncharacterized protein n=1 Tax=Monocercomonoides exilis TaxID=2049356 RepID=UPI00355AA3EA|nr:hypothetical protein MONOS_90 [Monocercomonoides exilis]|eukprot:MONOS_90.1-p1 / transcript=MONOS_90.1 / gene=MONOS_90 / organism=Monocercomonoides_exilis_PA203 / gene_product=unspecified product / transcript_product=unspecified product / location=Mono_scaffold00002:39832-40868(+) / protein_length=199 / sequence_SO=supercontig / SO=protein_coding / is_pseudo=false
MKEGDEMKTIQIEGSTVIRDSFNLSNYQIKNDTKMGEENVKATLNFEKAVGNQLEYFMGNDIHLELMNIQLQLTSGFDNSAKTIISNKEGELVITGCSFHLEAGANNGFDCVFVDAVGGGVDGNDEGSFTQESLVGCSSSLTMRRLSFAVKGEAPLSECDAEEAREMMRDGVRPLTEGINGEDLVEQMEKMYGDKPFG